MSEHAVRKNRTNPLFPQEEKLMCREEVWRGGRQRLQASTRALLLLKLLFTAVANGVDKVPVSLLACSAV